jgi:chromosome partitioning protein
MASSFPFRHPAWTSLARRNFGPCSLTLEPIWISKSLKGAQKVFDFLHVLLSRVDQADAASPAVRQWIQATYGEFVLPVEIPKTSVTSNKSAEFATVYDVQKYDGSAKTYKRAIDTYDRFVDLVEESVVEAWRARKAAS